MNGFCKSLKFLTATFALLITISAYAEAQECLGPDGPVACPTNTNTGGSGTSTSGSIFNRTSSGWTSTGWGNGGGAGGTSSGLGGLGGFFGSRFYVGRNSVSVSGPGGGISVGGNTVSGGTTSGSGAFGGYNDQINAAACTILGIPMGSFGALVMSFAGIIAIVSGAMGAYKMALSTIVVGAGSWILFPIVSMFFPVNCGF